MNSIGIDRDTFDIYARTPNGIWYSVWPAYPVASVAAFVEDPKSRPVVASDLTQARLVFREDSFDPVTRIRRGRFYSVSNTSRPSQQWALPHPIYGSRGSGPAPAPDGRIERWLHVFDAVEKPPTCNLIVIGNDESWWRVIATEKIVSGEYLVTLKARHALGVLPLLNPEAIPAAGRDKAVETYEKLVDSAYRETPGSIVDRARDAAQWFLATWAADKYGEESLRHEDLGALIGKVEQKCAANKPVVILSTARVITRLHARGKPNEQEKHDLRPPMEADAEFALAAVGLLLRELRWVA